MENLKFVDIAFNLTDRMYQGYYNGKVKHNPDLRVVIAQAVSQGVDKILATGVSLKESTRTIQIIKSLDASSKHLFSTVGVHPTNSKEFLKYKSPDLLLEELKKLINDNQSIVKAYGEFGLDRARTSFCPFEVQHRFFEPQVVLAESLGLPLFLHNRDAADLFYPILERHPDALKAGGVIHSFDGTLEDATKAQSLGLDIGINGCSMKTSETFEAIKSVGSGKVHFETDAPWCQIKSTHASFPLVKWTKSEDHKVVKNEKHQVPEASAPTPLAPEDFSPPGTPLVLVKGRNEPALVAEVAECVFRIQNPDCDDFEQFSAFTNQVYEHSVKLFNLSS